ncbi:MAG TPA: universal stress protein [Polyangiaceae bacterium]
MKYPIIVGTDMTEASDDALIQAEARATRDSATLTVVHAMSPLVWGGADENDAVERVRRAIQVHVTALTGRAEYEYEVIVERGLAHSVLARLAISQHALLIVGSHMHHGVGHAFLRDVTERVVQRARGPVLVTRPSSASGRILVAVERPFDSCPALDVAIHEARASGSKLAVLHCIHMGFIQTIATDLLNGGAYADRPLGQGSLVTEARQALRAELLRRAVDADLYVIEGEPTRLISEVAERQNAELLIVGTAHRPGPTPPVTTGVLRHAPCSVLIVDDDSQVLTASVPMQLVPN